MSEHQTYVVVDTDGAARTVRGARDDIDLLRAHTGGRALDVVRLDDHSLLGTVDIWVDDEGLLKQLPPNALATALTGQLLVGPVVFARSTPDGSTIGLTDDTVTALQGLTT